MHLQQSPKEVIIIIIPFNREVNSPEQGYTARKWLSRRLSLGNLTPELRHLKQKALLTTQSLQVYNLADELKYSINFYS